MVVSCGVDASPSTVASATTTRVVESPFFDGHTTTVVIGDEKLRVAVADTTAERSRGLRGATDLAGLDGMLFIHDGVGPVQYTMEDTVIPLDVWFIDATGAIVGTAEMEPCPTDPCPSYPSPLPVLQVLETEMGRYDFSIGDVVVVD